MANKRIQIAELEFDAIKANLKEFLRGQSQFSDYDFEGSNMSVILDILAYNTHYNALYNNMAINEVFLDSASRRDSVASLARSLGYVPRSSSCASTIVDFKVTNATTEQSSLTLERLSPFQGIKDGIRYTFYNKESFTAQEDVNGDYTFYNIPVYEGAVIENSFEYTDKNLFLIPNANVDLSTLSLSLQPNPSSTIVENYYLADGFASLDENSRVYFIKQLDGFYYIYFGDNIFGKRPDVGSIINVEYFVCSGEGPNGIKYINYSGDPIGGGEIEAQNFSIQSAVNGGRGEETIEEIRFNAPNFYASQNRAVTSLDYESLILKKVPAVEAVSVWGGENNVPPVYGKVFISTKTVSGKDLTYNEQQSIINNIIEPNKVVTVIPEFVSPGFIEVELDVVAYYDTSIAQNSSSTIRSLIFDALLTYDDDELQKFNKVLRHSAISRLVENTDPSILSCVPRMKMYRAFTPIFRKETNYTIHIGNPFAPGTIGSTALYITGDTINQYYFRDDTQGNLYLFKYNGSVKQDYGLVGSIDYQNGTIYINNLNITRADFNRVRFIITPSSADIASNLNQIVMLERNLLKVSVIADESSKGRTFSGNNFVFTPSRI